MAILLFAAVQAVRLFTLPAYPQEATSRGNWFKSLKQPGTTISCCDISDCKATEARWTGKHWQAMAYGRWVAIPDGIILKDKPSVDGDAYLCAATSYEKLYCFIPPPMGF